MMDNDEIERILCEIEAAEPGIDPEVELAWETEIERRVREIDSGEVELIDGEVVMAEMRALLAESPRARANSNPPSNDGAQ